MADDTEFIVAKEKYGSCSMERSYTFSPENGNLQKILKEKESLGSSILLFFKLAFLPQGYPESVSKDYLQYQIWDTLQAFCSSITGTLATQAMLKSYGVGDEKATILAATMTWILRSGSGMIGSIVFAWMQGSGLDCSAKKWRFFADILNDMSILVELLSPYFKTYFIYLACLSSVAKSIVGVAGGATRAALTQHQARRDNMADVAAKDGSQETLVNLMALLSGLVITPLVSGHTQLTWTLFFIFTFLHLYSNFRAVSSVVMETVNIPRLRIIMEEFLKHGRFLTPEEVAIREPVIFGFSVRECLKINLGTQFQFVVQNVQDFKSALPNSQDARYLMKMSLDTKAKSGTVHIVLHESSEALDHIQSCFQAIVLDFVIRTPQLIFAQQISDPASPITTGLSTLIALHNFCWQERGTSPEYCWDMVAQAHNFTLQAFPEFVAHLEKAGWVSSRTHLGPNEWRSIWNSRGVEVKKVI